MQEVASSFQNFSGGACLRTPKQTHYSRILVARTLLSRTPWIAGTRSLVPSISLYILCKKTPQARKAMARTLELKAGSAGPFF